MSNKEKILDHEYDGIHELDNPLPRWWLLTFYGAIVFSLFYLAHYHLGGSGKNPWDILAEDLAAIKAQHLSTSPQKTDVDEANLNAAATNPTVRSQGAKVFKDKCTSCHGASGEGSIGPNLTDRYWIHYKGNLMGIYQVVSEGVLDKGMPPWKSMLKSDEIIAVTAYVKSLAGTNPSNPKPPQGDEVK